jgi:dTDP-4-amino-4,6-dideoxygalactose transaminase
MKIRFVDLHAQYRSIKSEIDAAIASVIEETAFIGGKYVEDFERQFAQAYGMKHVIACGNGTDSLFIIMKMLGIGANDEVITVANSWISSSETISQTGARPVFVDIHPEFYSMDETKIEALITDRTKAVIAVHLQGQACAMGEIKSICERRNLFLIEDCAQSHFSEFNGRKAGLFGHAASFSFYPGKNLGAYGDAGCMATNDDALAVKCRMFARHGALKKHHHQIEGINSRMDGMQAAILSAKLPHLARWTERRIMLADTYRRNLSDVAEIVLPAVRPESKHTFHLFVIRAQNRNALMQWLSAREIETVIHYPTILPLLQAYQYLGHQYSDFPVAASLQSEILSLPMYPEMSDHMVHLVADAIREFYKQTS